MGLAVPHEEFVLDVKIPACVDSKGRWSGSRHRPTNTWRHNGLEAAEREKYAKHEGAYSAKGLGFLALTVSCFGVLGPTMVRLLWTLAGVRARKEVSSFGESSQDGALGRCRARHFAAAATRVQLAAIHGRHGGWLVGGRGEAGGSGRCLAAAGGTGWSAALQRGCMCVSLRDLRDGCVR